MLFRQTRIGLHGRPFSVLKFRSMVRRRRGAARRAGDRNEMNGPVFKVTDDPRITRVGRFLRRTLARRAAAAVERAPRRDEPGRPRPPLPDEVAGYDLWHRRRLSMKPGHHRAVAGPRPPRPNFDHWVEADLEYIDRWSLWLDVKILARTIPAALEGR